MINRDPLSGEELVGREGSLLIANGGGGATSRGPTVLLGEETGGTFWGRPDLSGSAMQTALRLGLGQDTLVQQELNLLEVDVAEALMPAQKLLFGSSEVLIVLVNFREDAWEGERRATHGWGDDGASRKVACWVDRYVYRSQLLAWIPAQR